MRRWFKNIFEKEKAPEETGIPIYTLNWFIHTLIENVGRVKWVRRTKEEQIKYDKENPHNAGYPYRVVQLPIPPGKDIVLKESGTYKIKCDSEFTRNLIIEMARSYDELERKYYHSLRENATTEWHKIEELPPHSSSSAFHERGRIFFVTSPTLCWVGGGTMLGFRDGNKWYVKWGNKNIEHAVTHYRLLPPHPHNTKETKYEDIKDEANRLRKELGFKYE